MLVLYKVRIEKWDKNGNNLGWQSEEMFYKSIDDAIERAREAYKENRTLCAKMMITISEDSIRIWKYLDGKAGMIDNRGKFIDNP